MANPPAQKLPHLLVATLAAYDPAPRWLPHTLASHRALAERIGAQHMVVSPRAADFPDFPHPAFFKRNVLSRFLTTSAATLLYLDADVLADPAPPIDALRVLTGGAVNALCAELAMDIASDEWAALRFGQSVQQLHIPPSEHVRWKEWIATSYFNAGIVCLSRRTAADLLTEWTAPFLLSTLEQDQLNLCAMRQNVRVARIVGRSLGLTHYIRSHRAALEKRLGLPPEQRGN